MNKIIKEEKTQIEDMINEINGKEVMIDREIVVIKCHDYRYDI